MRLAHAMPFGAECRADATRFRLWAPSCEHVALELGRGTPRVLDMHAQEGGWHELVVPGVGAGAAYAFRVDDGRVVPDPASRANPWDVGGPSMVVDPRAFEWDDGTWRGRPWHEAVVYELHVGTFTGEGTFGAAIARLDYLAALGVTAIELMPVADFAGRRNWGYDGVLPFAPDSAYGFPEDLKRLVEAAHERRLMVLLDVVYNHFGPEGNHLGAYAKPFFNDAHKTPWGAAINFDGAHARTVRDFFVHNALYWIDEFHLDGLRLDAVHAIADGSPVHIVEEIARAIADGPGRERHVHLVLENDANSATLLRHPGEGRGLISRAQWNDDAHHAFHVLLTGERDGYYADYAAEPARHLARALAEGFAWQGETSGHRGGARRGEPSRHLPLTAFMPFLQNHDQVGNRATGERLAVLAPPERVRLALAILLLAPSVPLLFMGEEFGARTPFLYFCDFEGELANAVRDGRRREFASFARFADERAREAIPDPGSEETFHASRLDWESLDRSEHATALEHCRNLLALRRSALVPRLARGARGIGSSPAPGVVVVDWTFGDGARLGLRANLGDAPAAVPPAPGEVLHAEGAKPASAMLAGWSAVWTLDAAGKA